MKRLNFLVAAFLVVGLAGCKRKAASPPSSAAAVMATPKTIAPVAPAEKESGETFQISGPTIIAFFPITQAEIDQAGGDNEALSDFQNYLYEMNQPLQDAHIRVEQNNDPTFQVEVDGKLLMFNAKAVEEGYGYYFIEPGKAPHVVTEMMVDEDFQQQSKEYFGIVVADPKPDDSNAPKSDSPK
jgi:hypothetical protein